MRRDLLGLLGAIGAGALALVGFRWVRGYPWLLAVVTGVAIGFLVGGSWLAWLRLRALWDRRGPGRDDR